MNAKKYPNTSRNPENVPRWCTAGHASIIEYIYQELTEEVKKNLDVNAMIDGSNDPDEKFKDMRNHHYPVSHKKAVQWLNDGKSNYDTENYNRASYCFGIASHYISDTFSAPHNISGETGKEHHDYEVVNDDYIPNIQFLSGDLDSLMSKGVEQGDIDWKDWKKTKDPAIPHKAADMGASVAYSALKNILE